MDTLIDYVRWMGEFDFTQKPMNEVDALVICQIGYLDMKPVYKVPGVGTPDVKNVGTADEAAEKIEKVDPKTRLSVREITDRIDAAGLKYNIRTVGPDNGQVELQRLAASSKRFGEIICRDYVDEFDNDMALQFSAVTFEVAGLNFICFCGTDHTIAGWKEDFMISFTHTGAQDRAVQYAEEIIAQDPSKKYILCGQSKGGNLALYAACMINDESWEKVEHVYYLDGPGLCPEVTKLSKLDRIQDRTTCIGPEYAIIGKLFPVEIKDTRIVKSSLGGMMQHAMYSWGVDHGELATVPKNDPRSTWVNQVIDKWLTGISQEERKEFVNELFDALSNKGELQTLDEIGSVDSVENVLVNMLTLSPRARKIAMELPRVAMLSQEAQKDVQDTIATVKKRGPIEWFTQSEVARGVVTILAGGIIAFLSQFIVNLLFILPLLVVSAGVVFFTVRRLYRSHWNFESERFAVTTSILLVVGLIVLLVKDQAIFLLGTMMLGILMMVFAYNMMSKIPSTNERFAKWIVIFETIFAAVFGLSFLIIPEHVVTVFALSIGVAMVVDGVVHVVHARWAKEEKKKISSASSQSKG